MRATAHSRHSKERVPRRARRVSQTQGKVAHTVGASLALILGHATDTRLVTVALGLIARSNIHRDVVDRPSKQEKLMVLIMRGHGL